MCSLFEVTYEEILYEINSLDTSKSTQSEEIPFEIIKDNADIFVNFILQNFNKCIIDGKFHDQLKKADVSPVFKKGNQMIKPIINWSVSYPRFQKFMSISSITR